MDKRSWKKGLTLASLMGLTGIILILFFAPEHPLFWFLLVLWGIAFSLPLYIKSRDPLELWVPFVAYFFVLFPLRALYDALKGEAKFFDLNSYYGVLTLSLFYALLGLLSFYWGYFQPLGKKIAQRLPSIPQRFSSAKLLQVSSIFFLIGILSFFLLFRFVKVWEIWISRGEELSVNAFRGKYYLLWGGDFLTLLFVLLYAAKDKIIPKIMIFLSFTVALGVGILLGAKETILQPVFYWLILRHYTRRRLRVKEISAFTFLVILLILFFPFLKTYGPQGLERAASVSKTGIFWKDWPDFIISRFYGAESLALILKNVPSSFPYKFGETFLELFIQPIPRFIWADKPLSIGFQFTRAFTVQYYGPHTSSALSLPGEFYLNFGLPGILIGFAIFGVLGRVIYEYLGQRRGASYAILYALTLYAIVMLNEGNLSGRLPFYLTKLIPTFLAILYITKVRGSPG